MLGQPVGFALPSDEGKLVTLPLPGSKATVLDFFSPTCVPCKESLPALYATRDRIAAKGGRLLLVAVLADNETTEDARRALTSWGVEAPFLVDHEGVSQREAGVRSLPATLVLDATGVLRWVAPPGAPASAVSAALP
jgi:thiol-disulfide isomerase/thioredoxin